MRCMQNILLFQNHQFKILIDHLDKNIIAVGTTSLRTLESLYWLGVKQSTVNSQQSIEITQWEVYDHEEK